MFVLILRDVSDVEKDVLVEHLVAADGSLKLLANVPSLVFANSYAEIAFARLAVWYIAEVLADHGSDVQVNEIDNEDGSSDVEFQVSVALHSIDALAGKLYWLAPAFDQDYDEYLLHKFDFGCEIEGWLSERGDTPCRFPKLKLDYELDAAAAEEQRALDGDG